jgi:hypothetical protein
MPVPRKTTVDVPAPPRVVGRGDDVRIEAFARGIVPKSGWLEVRSAGSGSQSYVMEGNGTMFSRTIENVQTTFDYQVRLNDGRSAWFAVKVLPRPSVARISCEQIFPAYTQLPPRTPAMADLSLLAGSLIRLAVVPSKDVVSGSIRLVGVNTNIAMQVIGSRELRGEFRVPAKGMNGFAVHLRDTDGMDSADAAVYRVDILANKTPAVRITSPTRREELFTRQATALIGMEVVDDFQVAKLRLRYKADGAEDTTAKGVELEPGSQPVKTLQRRFDWNMSGVVADAGIGGRIEFWIEAEDNNDVTGPGVGRSERYFARLVTDEEKRADLWNRASDTLSGINDLASDQEKLNQALGTLIREKAGNKAE